MATKSEIAAAFEAAKKQVSMCNVGRIIAEHEAGALIKEKIDDNLGYSAATISRVLKGLGFPPVSSNAINSHRKRACRCQ